MRPYKKVGDLGSGFGLWSKEPGWEWQVTIPRMLGERLRHIGTVHRESDSCGITGKLCTH